MRVLNRRRYRKHPDTGKRSSVLNPPEDCIRQPAPELRIIDDELWKAVQARLDAQAEQPKTLIRRPKRLLSGLTEASGGLSVRAAPQSRLRAHGGCGEFCDAKGTQHWLGKCATRDSRGDLQAMSMPAVWTAPGRHRRPTRSASTLSRSAFRPRSSSRPSCARTSQNVAPNA